MSDSENSKMYVKKIPFEGVQMETDQLPRDTQTATSPDSSWPDAQPSQPAAAPADGTVCLSAPHWEESETADCLFERAKAQDIYMHGEALRRESELYLQDGGHAQFQLANHIHRSLPSHLRAKPTMLRKWWYSVHLAAADKALRQVVLSARRLGLTHVEDTKGFVADHCGWYVAFCILSRMCCVFALARAPRGETRHDSL
jgi:hypothetical protein